MTILTNPPALLLTAVVVVCLVWAAWTIGGAV